MYNVFIMSFVRNRNYLLYCNDYRTKKPQFLSNDIAEFENKDYIRIVREQT